jgi:hypothetical protein
MSNPTQRQMQGKMEEQLRFIMAECGLTEPADVPWIEEGGRWHKRLIGIDGHLDVSITGLVTRGDATSTRQTSVAV